MCLATLQAQIRAGMVADNPELRQALQQASSYSDNRNTEIDLTETTGEIDQAAQLIPCLWKDRKISLLLANARGEGEFNIFLTKFQITNLLCCVVCHTWFLTFILLSCLKLVTLVEEITVKHSLIVDFSAQVRHAVE